MSLLQGRTPANNITEPAFPLEVREAAYQLWAYVCDRNAVRVAEYLNGPVPETAEHGDLDLDPLYEILDGREVKPDTIRVWARRHQWADRIPREFRDQAPTKFGQVAVTLMAASTEAADYLRKVVKDEKIEPKIRVDAAKTILDRAGHLPYNRPPDDTRPQGPTRDYSGAIAGKSTEEIVAELFGLPSGVSNE